MFQRAANEICNHFDTRSKFLGKLRGTMAMQKKFNSYHETNNIHTDALK